MRRTLFEPEHEFFRDTVRRCFETEFLPRNAEWEATGAESKTLQISCAARVRNIQFHFNSIRLFKPPFF